MRTKNAARITPAEHAHMGTKGCHHNGCTRKVVARGYCWNHYMQLRRAGSDLVAKRSPESDKDYIAARVSIDASGCWIWKLSTHNGYGRMVRGGRSWPAHAFSYKAHVGEIPSGLQVNHKCHNRACVNPDHLYAGTQKENMADMVAAGRQPDVRGEASATSKLTEAEVREILRMPGIAKHAAERFGISISLVYAIRKRAIWKHIHA